jgi:rsbT co-antagonist protein RsbR
MSLEPTSSVGPTSWETFEFLQSAIDSVADPVFVKDLQHRFIACNQAFGRLLGQPRELLIGHSDPEFVPREQYEVFWQVDRQVTATGEPHVNEGLITDADGNLRTIWTRKFPIRDEGGNIVGLCGIITDITAIKHRQEEVQRLEAQIQEKMLIIQSQASLLDELAVPVIQIWKDILLLPLIGVMDSRRAVLVMENLLESIARARAQIVIVDITGVPMVDTSVASNLIRAVQAAELLGCQTILVGISPEIAQTLVGLGVDFSHITTRATLQNGLEDALKRLDYVVEQARRPAR